MVLSVFHASFSYAHTDAVCLPICMIVKYTRRSEIVLDSMKLVCHSLAFVILQTVGEIESHFTMAAKKEKLWRAYFESFSSVCRKYCSNDIAKTITHSSTT